MLTYHYCLMFHNEPFLAQIFEKQVRAILVTWSSVVVKHFVLHPTSEFIMIV
jgi:hypothetical protein